MTQSIEKFQSVQQYPATVDLFALLFEKAGIRVVDTGEEFSCYHRGTHIDFAERLDEASVDYVLELNTAQVDHLIDNNDSLAVNEYVGHLVGIPLRGVESMKELGPSTCGLRFGQHLL